jgi:hypothetical protein
MVGDINHITNIELSPIAVIWIVSLIISIMSLAELSFPWITPIAWIVAILGFIAWIIYIIKEIAS